MSAAQLILASGSPQRRAILEQIGVTFEVRVSGAEELEAGPAVEVALENAYRKAAAVVGGGEASGAAGAASGAAAASGIPVLGVDTVVTLGGELFGKPGSADEAAAMISRLAGQRHEVISGVCVIAPGPEGRPRTAAARTLVSFRALTEVEVARYVALGEWRGRAGGYAIQEQGATLVRGIEGDYLNVVGLPVATLLDLLPGLLT